MRPILQEVGTGHSPESLVAALGGEAGVVLLRSRQFDLPQARYSFVTARPLVTFRSSGSVCEILSPEGRAGILPALVNIENKGQAGSTALPCQQFGNPWQLLDALMSRFELLDEMDLPFPLGGCFGYWGYDLKNFVEARLHFRLFQYFINNSFHHFFRF